MKKIRDILYFMYSLNYDLNDFLSILLEYIIKLYNYNNDIKNININIIINIISKYNIRIN